MKIIINYILSLSTLFFLYSCKKDKLETYSGGNFAYLNTLNGDNIINKSNSLDTFNFDFTKINRDTIQLNLTVNFIGEITFLKRNIDLRFNSPNTFKSCYYVDSAKFYIDSNKNQIIIPISIFKNPVLKDTSFSLSIDLYENGFFKTDFVNIAGAAIVNDKYLTHRIIIINNKIIEEPPVIWNTYIKYLGRFTNKKFNLMLANIPGLRAWGFDSFAGYTEANINLIASYFQKNYLNTMELAGNTVFEDDGTKMKMGPAVQ